MNEFKYFLFFALAISTACGANEGVLKSGKETSPQTNAAPRQTTFAKELDEFRTADFRYIFVLRRKDGGEIDVEDRSVIKLNTTDANRRVSADNGKAFIIGTNNAIPPRNIAEIYERFAVEDYSPSPETNTTADSNAAK
ncbi:MAG: hypothetical protein WBD16_01870 [Pyrinomonadaceae bacterium]